MPLRHETSRRLLLIATVPAVIVGFMLEHAMRGLFGSPLDGFAQPAQSEEQQQDADHELDERERNAGERGAEPDHKDCQEGQP